MKIKTESGFSCEISGEARDDIELLELLIRLDKGDVSALPEATERLLGEKGKKALYDHLRGKEGRVSTRAVFSEFSEIFKATKETKNS